MNVLAAPFLFVLPSQIEAFACFSSFIELQAPRYVSPTLEGVHAGLRVSLLLPSLLSTRWGGVCALLSRLLTRLIARSLSSWWTSVCRL